MLAKRQVAESPRELKRLLHPGTHRPAAHQHENISSRDPPALDSLHRLLLGHEYSCRSRNPIYPIRPNHRRIDGGTLNNRPFWREISMRETDGRRHSAALRFIRTENHIIRINTLAFET